MTPSLTAKPPLARRPARNETSTSARRRAHGRHNPARQTRRVLQRYVDCHGSVREVLMRAGAGGSVLVMDRDARTRGDGRLVAHLGADEPPGNAALMCRLYLDDERRARCRPVTPQDARIVPFVGHEVALYDGAPLSAEPTDRQGRRYRLEPVEAGMSIPELRWRRYRGEPGAIEHGQLVSVREAVARLESYEPIRSLTARALALQRGDLEISTTVLRAELGRVQNSPILLNRRLREVVLDCVDRQQLSMSEIAVRCGRVKRDRRGKQSGETSWLGRRLGLLPEAGQSTPTPWIHCDVLALIARRGLAASPREVEVA